MATFASGRRSVPAWLCFVLGVALVLVLQSFSLFSVNYSRTNGALPSQFTIEVSDNGYSLPGAVFESFEVKPYKCFEPAGGLSSPVFTMISELNYPNKTIMEFSRGNKMTLAMKHGYRYCEVNESPDPRRHAEYNRIALMMAVLPCSDYVLHIDGDSVIFNYDHNFARYVTYMQEHNVDVLLSKDFAPPSPINAGVFLVKNTAYSYNFLKEIYNICACDPYRAFMWPHSQGLLFEWTQLYANDTYYNAKDHIHIIDYKHWNDYFNGLDVTLDNFIVHYAGCCWDESRKIWNQVPNFRFAHIIREYFRVRETSQIPHVAATKYKETQNTCLEMRYFEAALPDYYARGTWVSSLLKFRNDKTPTVDIESVVCPTAGECFLESKFARCKDSSPKCGFRARFGECTENETAMVGTREKPGECVRSCNQCHILALAALSYYLCICQLIACSVLSGVSESDKDAGSHVLLSIQ